MRLDDEAKERIRRSYYIERKSMRQIAREEGYSRPTVEKAITNHLHNPYRLTRAKPSPIFGPYKERVEALLQQNDQMPRKQRYTVHRIFEIIRTEGYQGSESRLRQYVAARRQAEQIPEVFLPLEFEPGQDAQVDWGEALATIDGQKQKVQVFVMHLCYSRRTYAACFPSQNQESFLWAHIQAFHHFGGVPQRISYDNLATAVKLVVDKTKKRGRSRKACPSVYLVSRVLPVRVAFLYASQGKREGRGRGVGGLHETQFSGSASHGDQF